MSNKIGILTWHHYGNYGSGLQAFALQQLLKNIGYKVEIINYRKNANNGIKSRCKKIVKTILHNTIGHFSRNIYNITAQGAANYQKKYLQQTRLITTPEELTKIAEKFRCIVYGSDQIWAPNVYNPIYMGAYIPENTRKISYAASIGLNNIPDNLVETYKKNLSTYYAIAIRETEGKELLKQKCGLEAQVVLDPTLMIEAPIYRKMLKPVKGIKGEYVFCYFLNKDHQYRQKVEEYARKNNLQIIGASDNPQDAEWLFKLSNIGADQFLWLIHNAHTVFTDSYHGSIFSLLFHKELWTFVRFEENDPICQNSRIRQLQNNFNLGHRIISSKHNIDNSKPIDYNYFEEQLAKLRAESLKYITNALR